MVSKFTTQDDGQNKQFKPKIYQCKKMGQKGIFYDRFNYDQRNYQNRFRSGSRDKRISFSGRYSVDKIIETDQGMSRIIGMNLGEEILD